MIRVILLFLLGGATASILGQNIDTILSNRGELNEFTLLDSKTKYENAMQQVSIDQSRSTRLNQKVFYEEINFSLDQLLKSGSVIYNDPIAEYLNEIKVKLLRNDPGLSDSITILVNQSSVPNAFSTDQGIIVINTEMIRRLENEAQLAFVIGHEIAHFKERHVFKSVFEEIEDVKKIEGFRKVKRVNPFLKHSYLKSLETEADRIGFDYFIAAGYKKEDAFDALDALGYLHLPKNETQFDLSSLQNKYIQLEWHTYTNETRKSYELMEDYNESESTHPAPLKRRNDLITYATQFDIEEFGQEYIISKEKFEFLQNALAYTTIDFYFDDERYLQCLYLISDYEKNNPFNPEIEILKTNALLRLSFVNMPIFSSYTGEFRNFVQYMNTLSKDQLQVMTIASAFSLNEKLPNREEPALLLSYILNNMIEKGYAKSENDFVDQLDKVILGEEESVQSPYLKIDTTFREVMRDSLFLNELSQCFKKHTEWDNFKSLTVKEKKKSYKEFKKEGVSLNAANVIYFQPKSLLLDFGKEISDSPKVKFIKAEEKINQIIAAFSESSAYLEMNNPILDCHDFVAADVAKMNMMKEVEIYMSQLSLDPTVMFLPRNYKIINEISSENDISLITSTVLIESKYKMDDSYRVLFFGILNLAFIPYTAVKALSKQKYSYMYNYAVNPKTNTVVFEDFNEVSKGGLNASKIRMLTYNFIRQLK